MRFLRNWVAVMGVLAVVVAATLFAITLGFTLVVKPLMGLGLDPAWILVAVVFLVGTAAVATTITIEQRGD